LSQKADGEKTTWRKWEHNNYMYLKGKVCDDGVDCVDPLETY